MRVTFPQSTQTGKNGPIYVYKDIDLSLNRVEPTNTQLQKTAESHDISSKYDNQSILNSISTLLSTKRGEKSLNPVYGCSLEGYLFEPLTPATIQIISSQLTNQLSKWEPRITVTGLTVSNPNDDVTTINIVLSFTVPTLNISSNANISINSGSVLVS